MAIQRKLILIPIAFLIATVAAVAVDPALGVPGALVAGLVLVAVWRRYASMYRR